MTRRTISLLLQSVRYYNYSRAFYRRNSCFLNCYFYNLNKSSEQTFLQNVKRYMSVSPLSLPEADLNKFLKHLIDAYTHHQPTEFAELLQNHQIKKLLNERIIVLDNLKSLSELEQDEEMKKLAAEEKINYESQLKQIDDQLIDLVTENLIREQFDDLIMEVTAGVGGQEAMLFVKDLLDMYINHLSYLGYSYDIIELDSSAQGGVRHASIMISGKGAFEKLRNEAGVHRVQRVPSTENSGRMHTSVVSVAVMPQPNDIQVQINPKDLRIDTMRASGAGGQHVNTTNSAVRIVHIPTGTVSECQTQRSQIKNRELAMAKLRAKIYQEKLDRQMKNSHNMRKQQMGMGERHEKIRTYNYNQDRVTDHRISNGTMHNLEGFLNGGKALDGLHDKLNKELHYKILLETIQSLK